MTSSPKAPALFYTRDSGGRHETTPGQYVLWAAHSAQQLGVPFTGTPEAIEHMIVNGISNLGDLYLDFNVQGHVTSRPGLDALLERVKREKNRPFIFIPRPDRLMRPNHPLDGMQLELQLRSAGATINYFHRALKPLERGVRDQIGDLLTSMVDFEQAGKDRRDLAEKILYAQLTLAAQGYSTGGRAPYGFRRWLVKVDGTRVRELAHGERVRMKDHHVVWLPVEDDHPEMVVIRRIVTTLPTMPASQLAAQLTLEGIPSPDAGRTRTDHGVEHLVSGDWHATTIVNIALNRMLGAVALYGRRSMGDQLRFDGASPRTLTDVDFLPNGKPKVIQNQQPKFTKASFDPVFDPNQLNDLKQIVEERGKSQRGKPRSRDPDRNPAGGRVFDLDCTWPMYRVPDKNSFAYKCGRYMQSHGAECHHNKADGPTLIRTMLNGIKQQMLTPKRLEKLREALRLRAESQVAAKTMDAEAAALRKQLQRVHEELETGGRNLALAKNEKQFEMISKVVEELTAKAESLESELKLLPQTACKHSTKDLMNSALADLEKLEQLAADDHDLKAVGTVFDVVNARAFVGFKPEKLTKRTVYRVDKCVVTLGTAKPPIEVYMGRTAHKAPKNKATTVVASSSGKQKDPLEPFEIGKEGQSLGNVSRGDRI